MGDDKYTDLVLERIKELREDVGGVGEKVESLRGEVQATYARESDCAGRALSEREQRGESLKRIHERVDAHELRIDAMSSKVSTLVQGRAETIAVEQVRGGFLRWAIGLASALLIAIFSWWLKGKFG